MAEIDKKQIALFAGIGLFVVAMVIWSVSLFSEGEKETKKQESGLTMQAPEGKPVEQSSSLDVYQQEIKAEESKKEEFSFNPVTDERPEAPAIEPEKLTTPEIRRPSQTSNRQLNPSKPNKIRHIQSMRRTEKLNEEEVQYDEGLAQANNVNKSNGNSRGSNSDNSFTAIFHGSQTLVDGSPVKLRLTKDFSFNGHDIPSGTIVEARANFSGDFVYIDVVSIMVNGTPFDCKYTGYKGHARGFYSKDSENKQIVRENVNNNTNKGITIGVPIIGGSISANGLNRKTSSKEREITIPSQTSMTFSIKDNL